MTASELETLRQERDLYRRLLELGSAEHVEQWVADVVSLVTDVVGAHKGYAELVEDDERIAFARVGLSSSEVDAVRAELSRGIIAEALSTGRTIATASAMEDPRFSTHTSVQGNRIEAVLCAPLQKPNGDSVGVVYLQGRGEPGPFSEEDRGRLELVARHVGPFVDRLLVARRPELSDPTLRYRQKLAAEGIVGRSAALAKALRQLVVAAPVPVAVLLTGPSGTGKTALAQVLHRSSPRAGGPFVELNCAALPESLLESELFGAEKGAHSTATSRLAGKVEAAEGGTLFLDEVAELPLTVQGKLLTFLQSKRYYPLGSNQPCQADVRIVAATNANLGERVQSKTFREDLLYRLNVIEVEVPALEDRRADVPQLADALVARLGDVDTRRTLTERARLALAQAEWPGNVRQLENVLARGWATALADEAACIDVVHLFPERADEAAGPETYQEATRRFQRDYLQRALDEAGGNVSEAARRLDLARSRLNELIKSLGITRS